jgi:adenylate kinase
MFFNRPPEIIFLIGPQGSGKGTQGKKLAEEFGYAYWETGAILREEVKKQTVLGKKIASAIEHGKLLPDEIIIQLLIDRLPGFKHHNIIFDGVTRKMAQTKFLLDYLKKLGYKRITAVVLDIPHEESVKRLVGRAKVEGRKDIKTGDEEFDKTFRLKSNSESETLRLFNDQLISEFKSEKKGFYGKIESSGKQLVMNYYGMPGFKIGLKHYRLLFKMSLAILSAGAKNKGNSPLN